MTPCSRILPALPTLWREADVSSLHCPLTADPSGLPNARTPAACRRGTIVVNSARGGRADQAALLAAVRSGQVAAAGPAASPSSPWAQPTPSRANRAFVLSPHSGGVMADADVKTGAAAAQNVLRLLPRLKRGAA